MADKRQRDRAIEQLLKHSAGAAPSTAPAGVCVDGETLAAWSSGGLASDESARVEAHLADCARCQSMLAAFARTEPIAEPPIPWWQRAHARWLVPLATAATVAAIWVAIPQRTETPQRSEPAGPTSEQRFKAEPLVVPSQPAPSVSAESAPSAAQGAAPRREAPAAPQRKQEPTARRADEADARKRVGESVANERAAAAPQPTAPPAAAREAATPPPAALAESITVAGGSPSVKPQPLARGADLEIISPGGATRWRIVGGQAQRSTTQGQSWEAIALPSATITAGHCPSSSVVWLVGRAGAVFVTTDGARFEQVPFVSSADLMSVVAVDGQQAIVTTVDGRRFRTTDRGVTWGSQ